MLNKLGYIVSHLPLRPPLGSRRGKKKKNLLNNPADPLIFIPPNKKKQWYQYQTENKPQKIVIKNKLLKK